MRKGLLTICTLVMIFAMSFTVYAAEGWQKEGNDWYYYRDDNKLVNEWLTENDKTYYFGPDGRMLTGMHIINGKYYDFFTDGVVTKGGFTIWNDLKITFDDKGAGTATPISPEEALYSSTCVKWMDQTYAIYDYYRQEMRNIRNISGGHIETPAELLSNDWGITSREDGITTINGLFESGKASDDKSEKAWNYSRAIMLCDFMKDSKYIDARECRSLQYEIAPTIQQSFISWDEFYDSYMIGFRRWASSIGLDKKSKDMREDAYKGAKNMVARGNEFEWVQWEIPLLKLW